ncbi:hypothetical protein JIN85_01465 [Luteolibacter pohnpeiensis]|uniref:Thioredoxin-like fold domain-containing protein n=1 Tax=Luteolibacter pohnpeiensis TaxID=454153 RepID=A0A934VPJ1_9BACT|nr:thioredoxin fold domain-containing protein [Luteolibacter pohnpeiensis]MBK1881061.1 hypothetical protein [Luteolibacter pohnpeiensis]
MLRFTWIIVIALGTWSCAKLTPDPEKKKDEDAAPFGMAGVPKSLYKAEDPSSSQTDIMGNPVAADGSAINLKNLSSVITPEKDIAFTDPYNPYAELPELSSVMAEGPKSPWELSETDAKSKAMREGKPLLIWFSDSSSPMDKAISEELFSRFDFGDWANENMVRLKIDANLKGVRKEAKSMSEGESLYTRRGNYVERLEKQYNIMGHPSFVMLNPSGEVINRYRGYKRGDADYFWGSLKQNVVASNKTYAEWRKGLEKNGYRDWTGHRGRTIFAKLKAYSKGQLVLIEPDGNMLKTKETNLSADDRDWINELKRKRGIQ